MFNYFLKTLPISFALCFLFNTSILAQGFCGPQSALPADARYDPVGALGDFFFAGFTVDGNPAVTGNSFAIPVSESGRVIGCAVQAATVSDNGTPRLVFDNLELTRAEDCYASTIFGPPTQMNINACEADVGQEEGLIVEDNTGMGNYEGFYFILYEPSGGGQFFRIDNGGALFDGSAIAQGSFGGTSTEAPPTPTGTGVPPSTFTVPSKSFSSFSNAIQNNQALPVELTTFDGQSTGKSVQLEWATASETDNEIFIVERAEGQQFVAIGQVMGAGTSSVLTNYTFVDPSPRGGLNHYRLRQRDYGGAETISHIIAVQVADQKGFVLQVYPNPAVEFVKVTAPQGGAVHTVQIIDAAGNLVHSQKLMAGLRHWSIDVSNFRPGVYQARAIGGEQVSAARLLVQ